MKKIDNFFYKKVIDYFDNLKGYSSVYKDDLTQLVIFKKIGSDLKFNINLGELVYLKVYKTDINFESGFTEQILGEIEYKINGICVDMNIVSSRTNDRQKLELDEVMEHVKKSIRPNSINFLMED